jgi:hypothetical protein
MADSTRSQQAMKVLEERLEGKLSVHLDAKFMELAASFQQTMQESILQTL